MKKYLLSALALPLLFACSSEDYLDQKATDNDQFAGIEKVDATFSMAESPKMRMDKGSWDPQEGDLWGFAWMGDGDVIKNDPADGKAYQNHNLIQVHENETDFFKPQTSIYVGKYYIYRPYDVETVSPQAINFKSLEEQTLAEGQASGYGTDEVTPWKNLAKTAINIGDKWTDVTKGGTGTWDKAGIGERYKLYAAPFSNQTGLDLTYQNNNVEAPAAGLHFAGATDIDYTIAAGTKIGAADIYDATVALEGAAKSFTYAPTKEPNNDEHKGTFWADKEGLAAADGFTFTDGAVTLKAPKEAENGISTDKADNKGWFWFNSLPITSGIGLATAEVNVVLTTSYGTVTVKKDYTADTKYTVADCAYAGNVESGKMVWHPLADAADNTKNPTVWAVAGTEEGKETFINQYGNHKGKFALNVDFSKGVMNGMHIKNDAHLQKLLKYYIASGKTENPVVLNLDATDGVFEISKISIALLQTINAGSFKVGVRACIDAAHTPAKIIVTQDGQDKLGLANAKEVPALNNVFAVSTDVYLSKDCEWTWSGGEDGKTAINITNKGGSCTVNSITNEGTLTVKGTNVELSKAKPLYNAAKATMNITKVTTVKNALTNLGTINVGSSTIKTAELRAYNAEIKNDATGLTAHGVINNFGVIGSTSGTTGEVNNYGLINMMNNGAMTLLKSNEIGTDPFKSEFADGNKMGTVVLPENNPTAIVSVANKDANGFIKYTWTGKTYKTPEGNVKYNTIVVSDDITFTTEAEEIQYIEFNGTRTQVVNPATDNKLTKLEGIIVNKDASIIIEKNNKIDCADGAFLGTGATVYKGGEFKVGGAAFAVANTTMYLGKWSLDQIVVWGE